MNLKFDIRDMWPLHRIHSNYYPNEQTLLVAPLVLEKDNKCINNPLYEHYRPLFPSGVFSSSHADIKIHDTTVCITKRKLCICEWAFIQSNRSFRQMIKDQTEVACSEAFIFERRRALPPNVGLFASYAGILYPDHTKPKKRKEANEKKETKKQKEQEKEQGKHKEEKFLKPASWTPETYAIVPLVSSEGQDLANPFAPFFLDRMKGCRDTIIFINGVPVRAFLAAWRNDGCAFKEAIFVVQHS